jgi:hypothetical protein
LEQLPHIKVDPDELKEYIRLYDGESNKKIVISQFTGKHLVKRKDGKRYN